MISRGITPKSSGVVHWSISSLTKNPGLGRALLDGPYKKQALVPPSDWLDNTAPKAPRVTLKKEQDAVTINWSHENTGDVFQWVIYYQYGKNWSYQIRNGADQSLTLKNDEGKNT